MLRHQKKVIYRVLGDILVLSTLLGISANLTRMWGTPTKRGFFCDDTTLKYPYRENTISPTQLYIIGLYTPILLIIVVEIWNLYAERLKNNQKTMTLNVGELSSLIAPLYNMLTKFLFGFAAERLIKGVSKYTVGRLRPHFFAVCQPQLADGSSCADSHNHGVYLQAYTCGPAKAIQSDLFTVTPEMLSSVHVSFPSGHSSLSFYGMIFIILYLQQRNLRHVMPTALVRHSLQLACLLLALFVTLSRVVDYKHHWSDVLAGAMMGASVAIAVSLCVQRQRWCLPTVAWNVEHGDNAAKQYLNVAQQSKVAVGVASTAATVANVNENLCTVEVVGR